MNIDNQYSSAALFISTPLQQMHKIAFLGQLLARAIWLEMGQYGAARPLLNDNLRPLAEQSAADKIQLDI